MTGGEDLGGGFGSLSGRRGDGQVEIVVPPVDSSVFWRAHGYPDPSIRWHHHEDVEFHLIREGPGTMLVGDAMVPFAAGQVTMIGSNVPHMWISNHEPGQSFPHRDVFCQVRPQVFERLADAVPDLIALTRLVRRAAGVISLTGPAAERAARLLVGMGEHDGSRRFVDLLELAQTFVDAPDGQWGTLLLHDYRPDRGRTDAVDDDRINAAIDHIALHLTDGGLSLESTAACVGMGPTPFSKFFHRAVGRTFSDFVRRMRIALACRLLVSEDGPVSSIPVRCGYANLSNFNRRFRQETGMSPSEYRRASTISHQGPTSWT